VSNWTNTIITWSSLEDPVCRISKDAVDKRINEIQQALRSECEWPAGDYHWNVDYEWDPVIIFTTSHPEMWDLCKAIRTIQWKDPAEVQLLWKDEHMAGFSSIFPLDDDWEKQLDNGANEMFKRSEARY